MAQIRFPEGQQRSGSSGGLVFSHNRAGPYIRARSIPVNPRTDRQTAARTLITNLNIAWQDELTALQRQAWENYAFYCPAKNAFGDVISLTGQNVFVQCNAARWQASPVLIEDAPTILETPPGLYLTEATCVASTGILTITWGGWQSWEAESGAKALLYVGIPMSPTRNYFNGPFRFHGYISGNTQTPVTSPEACGAMPWLVSPGQKVVVQGRISRADGRLSAISRVSFLVPEPVKSLASDGPDPAGRLPDVRPVTGGRGVAATRARG